MSITTDQARSLANGSGHVYAGSDKIGRIGQVYLDDGTGEPSWVTVKTGLFGTSESFAPLEGARVDGDNVVVDVSEDQVKNAPRIDDDGTLSPQEEDELYRYYGQSDGGTTGTGRDTSDADRVGRSKGDRTEAGTAAAGTAAGTTEARGTRSDRTGRNATAGEDRGERATGHDTSGPTTDDAMTRSEERLDVGTTTREAGRARLRKFVTTENVTETVPVSHEEVTLEREPITNANRGAADTGPELSDEEHEVVLHEEVPEVEKETVPVERVRLGTKTVTEDATVSEDVRKEHIEMEGDAGTTSTRGRSDRDATNRGVTDRGVSDREGTDRGVSDRDVADRGARDRGETGRTGR